MPWAASPPSTFCQEKVTTSSLSKANSWAKAAEVASQIGQTLAITSDEITVRKAYARGRTIPGKNHIAVKIDCVLDQAADHKAHRSWRTSSSF